MSQLDLLAAKAALAQILDGISALESLPNICNSAEVKNLYEAAIELDCRIDQGDQF